MQSTVSTSSTKTVRPAPVTRPKRGCHPNDSARPCSTRATTRITPSACKYVPLALLLMGFLEVTRYSIYLLMNIRRDVPFGDGGDSAITRVIRAQANFA